MNGFRLDDPWRSFGKTTFRVLAFPADFFQAVRDDQDWQGPGFYLAACVLVHVLMIALLANPGFAARSLVMGITFPFVTAAILYFFLTRVFKSRGAYLDAFRVTAYASAVTLFSWMSGVGLLLEFYRLYIMTKGLAVVFGVRPLKAFGAIAATMATYILVSSLLNTVSGGRFMELLR